MGLVPLTNKIMTKSKKYRNAIEQYDRNTHYTVAEACEILPKTSTTKFDATVEIHLNLNIDPKHADQQIRSTVNLPHGSGITKVVAAFVGEDKVKEAKEAGADFAGSDDLVDKVIQKKWTDFDVAVATPDMMRVIAKAGKILGTKGLMPNPKSGTVTTDVAKTIKEIKSGRVELRNDPQSNLHAPVGKVSFGNTKLAENINAFLDALKKNKPSGVKGNFIKSITVTTSMGPGIKIDTLKI